ncbi:MAG: alpha-glucoside-specific PTS transporter subunit IIBC [Collinsella sp.]|nr:alpha-glucoside-specific PTS transporter subunit IIBC [Collinsella sp.]
MMQKIQKFGGAMFTPVLLFSFAGITVGLGTLFTTEVIFGPLAAPGTLWYNCWNVVLQGGWTVFNQLPLLFAVSLPIGMAKKQNARACMEALITYLTFHYFVNTILTQWGGSLGFPDFADMETGASTGLAMIASIKTLDMGMIGALAISGITIALHNRFFDTELPEWLGTFSGSTFVYIVSFFVMIPVAVLSCLVWPHIQDGIRAFQGFVMGTGLVGVWVFVFCERVLIPFGLHHLLYSPFFYDNVVVQGGIYSAWAMALPQLAASTESLKDLAPWAAYTATGWSKMFGCTGIALAFYSTAKPEKRQQLLAMLIPITLTAIVCGITEPIEFTFLFIAPPLFVVHAALAATLSTVLNALGVVGVFSGGLIEMASLNFIPLMASHGMTYLIALIVGLVFVGIYFVVFRFLILKFDFKIPGREDDADGIEFKSKADYRRQQEERGGKVASAAAAKEAGVSKNAILAENVLDLLGGKDNIKDVTNCATRLRVNVNDETLVASDADFKAIGTSGVSKNGKSMQVIIGLKVAMVREEFERLL